MRFLYLAMLRWLGSQRSISDRTVTIDQQSHVDVMEANVKRLRALNMAVEKERERIAIAVGSWSRDTVSCRDRVAIPRVVGRDIMVWLPGLNAQEVISLANASAFDVKHHLFGPADERIIGIRPVQPLAECSLVWPKPKLVQDPFADRSAGGGPRIKRG